MPVYTDVVASRIEKYRAQLERENGNDADIDMAMFRIAIGGLIDAAFSGGGGGTSTSATTIAQGINQSSDIDTIVLRLTNIDANQINQSSVKAAIESATNLLAIVNQLASIDAKLIQEADIVSAIQSATDIDTLIASLNTIAGNTYPVGSRTIAQSQSVAIASDQVVPVMRVAKALNPVVNGSIVTGGDAILVAASPARTYFEFQNNSAGDLFINFGAVAALDIGFRIPPSSSPWYSPDGYSVSNSISIWGATGGQKFAYITG